MAGGTQSGKENGSKDIKDPIAASWSVYMLRCNDNSLYTGVTNNLGRRIAEHNGDSANGARYTRSRRPVALVYREEAADRQSACRREAMLKSLSKAAKEKLVARYRTSR